MVAAVGQRARTGLPSQPGPETRPAAFPIASGSRRRPQV